jgi:hypothetical protein
MGPILMTVLDWNSRKPRYGVLKQRKAHNPHDIPCNSYFPLVSIMWSIKENVVCDVGYTKNTKTHWILFTTMQLFLIPAEAHC